MCQKGNSEFILRLYTNPAPTVQVVQLKDMRKYLCIVSRYMDRQGGNLSSTAFPTPVNMNLEEPKEDESKATLQKQNLE